MNRKPQDLIISKAVISFWRKGVSKPLWGITSLDPQEIL